MVEVISATIIATVLALTYLAWRRYVHVVQSPTDGATDHSSCSVTETFGQSHLVNTPHQRGARWLTDIFNRSAERYPDHVALQIPNTGATLTYAELDREAEKIAAALSQVLTGPDQVVAIAMEQDDWQPVACHLGILRAGGTVVFLDSALPEAMISHMLADAGPAVVLTRGVGAFRDLPTLDIRSLPDAVPGTAPPPWLDDPVERLAAIFYTSGTTGTPKGVECHHAGYANLALTYADYFDLVPGIDATTLTSSLGYDGSISEMYSAWVSGCAVVMLTKEEVRSGPDLLPVLKAAEVTVLFCPPVVLSTLTSAPEHDLPYPLCRYIVPAGEAFPGALVEPWTRARRQIVNTYGPTEASTDTSRQSLRPDQPVTIGSPLANVTYVVLEPDTLRALPLGEAGELCIAGIHVAHGYRNLPEKTAEKFVAHPDFGRLYRTGDRCRIDPVTGQTHFLGRIDTQLKVRGHRVEVQAVEDILQTQIREIEAAVLDYQNEELVAFIVAPALQRFGASHVSPATPAWAEAVRNRLARQLPEPSVPTRFFLVENFALNQRSGKIDRTRLPKLSDLSTKANLKPGARPPITAITDTEGLPANSDGPEIGRDAGDTALVICRELFGASLGWDDTFADHGGHSILIAQLAQKLRRAGWSIPVRALLGDCNTARKITERPMQLNLPATNTAAVVHQARRGTERDEASARILAVPAFTARQILFLLTLYAPHLIGFLAVIAFGEIAAFFVNASFGEFLAVGVLLYLAGLTLPFANLIWALLIRQIFIGNAFRNAVAGTYPKWSRMHLRVWQIERIQLAVLRLLGAMFRSPPLTAFALRCLGATIGRNTECAHEITFSGPVELLRIGDGAAVQTGTYIQMARWTGQGLTVGRVNLGAGCKIGMRACVANGVSVGRNTWITPFTPILTDTGPDEMWEGAPAHPVGRFTRLRRVEAHCQPVARSWFPEVANISMQAILDFALLVAPAAAITWIGTAIMPGGDPDPAGRYFMATPLADVAANLALYVFFTTWCTIVMASVLACLFVRSTRTSPGLYASRSLEGALLLYRQRVMNRVQRLWTWTITGQYLRALAGLKFSQPGGSECDMMVNLVPEAATADAKVFWAHGCYTNMVDQDAGQLVLRQLDMPANFFAGNNCVAEEGHLPTNFLLGVSSPASGIAFRRQMNSRLGASITVAGNPPLRFASADFEIERRNQTLPSFALFFGRVLLNDIFSIGILRTGDVLTYVLLYTVILRLGAGVLPSALAALILTEVTLIVVCLLIKKGLVGGRWGSDHSAPFWSWRHFTYFFAQDCYFAWCRVPMDLTAGTVLPNPVLRAFGCEIGRRSIVASPLQAFDWNAVSIGDDAMVEGVLQYHSLENMTLAVKRARIGDGGVVNAGATVMGGAEIGAGTTVLPLSLVLKEMHVGDGLYWGSPAEPAPPLEHRLTLRERTDAVSR